MWIECDEMECACEMYFNIYLFILWVVRVCVFTYIHTHTHAQL